MPIFPMLTGIEEIILIRNITLKNDMGFITVLRDKNKT